MNEPANPAGSPTENGRPEDLPTGQSSGYPAGQAATNSTSKPPVRRPAATRTRQIDSHSLLQGQSVLLIEHQGELYRLQTTRQGKLILTK